MPAAFLNGAVAQLGERLNGIQEVDGSIPFGSTKSIKNLEREERPSGRSFSFLTATLTATGTERGSFAPEMVQRSELSSVWVASTFTFGVVQRIAFDFKPSWPYVAHASQNKRPSTR